jgi:hypothetical protein
MKTFILSEDDSALLALSLACLAGAVPKHRERCEETAKRLEIIEVYEMWFGYLTLGALEKHAEENAL